MNGSVSLSAKDRKALVRQFRYGISLESLRALILLLSAHGRTYLVMQSRRRQQATVTTPGNNEKRRLAGSIHWRTGQVFVSPPAPAASNSKRLAIAHQRKREEYLTLSLWGGGV